MTAIATLLTLVFAAEPTAEINIPKSLDDRLTIELFASEPDLVTPTGIAVDADGRVLVVESHTHFRPDDYDGPPADRILSFEDTTGDGRADKRETFFEGTAATMNLAVFRDGSVFVATRAEVFRLFDRNGDGKADDRVDLARLETPGNYPHNGLSGFAFDFAGNVYFGFGENLGAKYDLIGADGTTLSGGGEGGNVYCIGPDGTGLRQTATGFWNPFHLAVDSFERMFVVDNDPDSRPPCRLLHISEQGDYGYKFRNGRKGLHPFTAWNGELPGTLPMVAGTGEAPSAVVVYESDALPADYYGAVLSTSWGDHKIERFDLQSHGATYRSAATTVFQGDENFRPVGIAVAPDGSLFVSDWVDRSYPLHKKGRIWHIRPKDPMGERPEPDDKLFHRRREIREQAAREAIKQGEAGIARLETALAEADDPFVRATALSALLTSDRISEQAVQTALTDEAAEIRALAVGNLSRDRLSFAETAEKDPSDLAKAAALRRIDRRADQAVLIAALASDDSFVTHAARIGLSQTAELDELLRLAESENPKVRIAALLLLRQSEAAEATAPVPALLNDDDAVVRQAAVQWVAEADLQQYRDDLLDGLANAALTRVLFETYLAALERLDGETVAANKEVGGQEYVARLATDPQMPIDLRLRAVRMLRPDHPSFAFEDLKAMLATPGLMPEAIRSLRERAEPEATNILGSIAMTRSLPPMLRAEAIVGLDGGEDRSKAALLRLIVEDEPETAQEAMRSLRGAELTDEETQRIDEVKKRSPELANLAAFVIDGKGDEAAPPPDATDRWLRLLEGPADPRAGERIYFHPKGPGCYRCHQMHGRGGVAGPDLTLTVGKLDRRRLLESILQPSKEIAPQFTPWAIETVDGEVQTGILLQDNADGTQTYADSRGETFTLSISEIERRRPLTRSVMPDKLEETMTLQEFRNLMAYLERQ